MKAPLPEHESIAAIENNLIQYLDHFGRVPGGVLHQRSAFHAIEAGPLRRVYAARFSRRVGHSIEEALALFSKAPFPITWMVMPSSTPAHLSARLLEAGFVHAGDWTGMSLPLGAREIEATMPLEFACERVRQKQTLNAWVDIAISGFKLPPMAAPELRDVFTQLGLGAAAPFELYLGAWRGAPVATGMVYRQGEVVGVYWIATTPPARGNGLATVMTGQMLCQAQRAGAALAVLHATPAARGLYERMGFSACCTIGLYTWKPASVCCGGPLRRAGRRQAD